MLRAVPPERIPQGLHVQANRLVLGAVPILPPDSRPLVLLDNGNWATADVNDLYRQLINRGHRLSKLEELHAPLAIICKERRELQRRADALWANCFLPNRSAIGDDAGRRFCDCLKLATGYVLDGGRNAWSAPPAHG